jgi:copper chaperone CopZ
MKTIYLTMAMVVLSFTTLFAQAKTEKFEVKGNCGMCENRIEKAAKSTDGVSKADWDKESKMLVVSFDESKTSLQKVQKAIAEVGHDTPMVKAKDEVYNALPGCCKYDRTETKKEMKMEMKDHEDHNN